MTAKASTQTPDAFGALMSHRLRTVSQLAGCLVIGISIIVLIDWIWNIEWLNTVWGAVPPIRVNGAICVLLSGLALVCFQRQEKWWHRTGMLCALAVLAMTLLTIGEYTFNIHLTPYEILHHNPQHSGVPPERMPPSAAVIYGLAAIGLLLSGKAKQTIPAILVLTTGLLVLFRYIFVSSVFIEAYGGFSPHSIEVATNLSWASGLCIAVLGIGILFAEPDRVLDGLLCSSTRGGYVLRRFLPLALIVPLCFVAITIIGEVAHLYNNNVRWLLFVNSAILCFCWLTFLISKRLDDIDKSRLVLWEQRADIIYSLAHDLKVPVIGSQRVLELLLSEAAGELNPKQRGLLIPLMGSAQDQLQLIDNIVYEYQRERNNEPPIFDKCSITHLLNDCLRKVLPSLRTKDLTITVAHKVPLYAIEVDQVAMRRVINNLLHNAMNYIPSGGTLKITSSCDGEQFSFTISNSGTPLTDDVKKHMFERFWKSEEVRRPSTSSGLGLYICRQIVESHEGTISCRSDAEDGTVFTVNLPARAACTIANK